jgi:hypothetical protein
MTGVLRKVPIRQNPAVGWAEYRSALSAFIRQYAR